MRCRGPQRSSPSKLIQIVSSHDLDQRARSVQLTLHQGLGIGVADGIWAASGVALTAVASKIFFDEPLTSVMTGGIALINGGVLLVEVGASH
jgi:hypothetical protein